MIQNPLPHDHGQTIEQELNICPAKLLVQIGVYVLYVVVVIQQIQGTVQIF